MDEMVKKMFTSIQEKYGYPVEYWVRVLEESGLEKHGERVNHLKKEHGFTHGFANLVAHEAKNRNPESKPASGDELVDTMFKGKEVYRKFYESIIEHVKSFGDDVEIAPKKNYVSLRRDVQFAILQPSSGKRFDIGLVIKEHDTSSMEPAGSFNTMCTHRIRIEDGSMPDTKIIQALKDAYDEARR